MNQKEYQKTPKGRYITQRSNALIRGIPWDFTFESWWAMWSASGKWEKRGRSAESFVMCRLSGIGPYSPGNVRIGTMRSNSLESLAARKAAKEQPELDSFRQYPRTTAWDYPHTSDWLRFLAAINKSSTLKESA